MNNRIKLDTTMLQSNTAMHLMAFMLTQRDLLLDLVEVIKSYEYIIKSNEINDIIINKLDEPPLRRQLKEVAEDFEYIVKLHTHALHQRSGTKIYKKDKCRECDGDVDNWATNNKSTYAVD
jgi:hypothetical protein